MRTHLLALALALFFISATASGGQKGILVGGWNPIKNINDPHIQKIASFAVTEHNRKANTKLAFRKVVSGETQVVAGLNYKLVVAAGDGSAAGAKKYEVVVWEKALMHLMNLTSFKPIP